MYPTSYAVIYYEGISSMSKTLFEKIMRFATNIGSERGGLSSNTELRPVMGHTNVPNLPGHFRFQSLIHCGSTEFTLFFYRSINYSIINNYCAFPVLVIILCLKKYTCYSIQQTFALYLLLCGLHTAFFLKQTVFFLMKNSAFLVNTLLV